MIQSGFIRFSRCVFEVVLRPTRVFCRESACAFPPITDLHHAINKSNNKCTA